MSIQLRIPSLQERRPAFQSKSRSLIRASSPPRSPALQRDVCEAVESDGRPCHKPLPSEDDVWCVRHAQDLKDMNMAWDKFQKEAEKIEVRDPQTAKAKMQKLQLAMNLRRRLRERFHTRGVDTPDYTKWIAKVESDTRQLADALLSKSSHISPYWPFVSLVRCRSVTSYTKSRIFAQVPGILDGYVC